jgi:hypothetical protein
VQKRLFVALAHPRDKRRDKGCRIALTLTIRMGANSAHLGVAWRPKSFTCHCYKGASSPDPEIKPQLARPFAERAGLGQRGER